MSTTVLDSVSWIAWGCNINTYMYIVLVKFLIKLMPLPCYITCMTIAYMYSQTSIKRSPSIKQTLFKFPKTGPPIYCKFDLY